MSKIKHFYLFITALLALASCSRNKKADVSHIQLEVHIARFDYDLDKMQTQPMNRQAGYMQQKYGIFYQDYIEQILQAGHVYDTASYFSTLKKILSSKPYQDLKRETDSIYPNLDRQEAELTDAFKHIKYYFPEQRLPKMYAYISGFQTQTSIGNNYFAIGLDLFLGAHSKFYPALTSAYPRYISSRFTPAYITPRVVESIARENMFPPATQDRSLLSRMIYEGKILYLMDQILPDTPDSLKIGYSGRQLQWCQQFQADIWGYILEEQLLYETDIEKTQKYFTEAPFTPGLGEKNESAPRLAVWTGWQIVRQYMNQHPDVTLPQLMHNPDAQQILNNSHYHPKNDR